MHWKTSFRAFSLALAALFGGTSAYGDERLQAALTAVALAHPTPDRGEPSEARAERLDRVSGAVVQAAARATCREPWATIDAPWSYDESGQVRLGPCKRLWPGSTVELAALVWSLGYLESGFSEWVHAGRCRLHLRECDARKERGVWVVGAKSPWQLQRHAYAAPVWESLEGTGEIPTFTAAWTATRVIAASRGMCARWRPGVPWLHATIAAYATGSGCVYPRSAKRAAFVMKIESRVRGQLLTTASLIQ